MFFSALRFFGSVAVLVTMMWGVVAMFERSVPFTSADYLLLCLTSSLILHMLPKYEPYDKTKSTPSE